MRMRTIAAVLCVALCEVVMAQTPSSTAATPQPAATTQSEAKQLEQLQARYNDFAGLNRYRDDNATLPPSEKGRVIFYGDSITDAWGRRPNTGTFFPGKPYVNRGISGQTTPQMLIRFRQDVVALHPEVVVILAGTNDVAGNTGPSTLAMTEDNFASMTEMAQANHIRVVIASILPAADYPWKKGMEPAPKIRQLNAWLKDFCTQHKATYLDYWSALADESGGMKPGLSFDGVHPNAQGYAIMAPLAETALQKK
jgi:lysophospholipase L1-like esterase